MPEKQLFINLTFLRHFWQKCCFQDSETLFRVRIDHSISATSVQPPEYGDLVHELDGALAFFTCNINMSIAGESVLGCEGQFWNV